MSNTTNPNVPHIVYSATSKRMIEGEIFIKQPPSGGEYRSISICIDQDTLFELKE